MGFRQRIMGSCIKPCLVHLQTSVITNEENECFTNCTSKAEHTLATIALMNADADIERFDGFRP